jgi:MFS family permease
MSARPRSRLLTPTNIVLFLLCVMYFITYIDRVNVSTAAGAFRTELQLNNVQIGFVFSAFAYPYLLFQIIGGWVGDRFGARKTLTVCGLIWAGSTIAVGFVGGFLSLIAARIALGFGEGATFPVATRVMSDWSRKENRGYVQGITHASARLGNAATPPLVAGLIGLWNWRGAFITLGLVSLLWTAVWGFYFRDKPADHRGMTQKDLDELPPYGSLREEETTPWGPLVKRMVPVTIVYFCYGWTLWLFLSWIPQFFQQSFKLQLKDSALLASGVFFAGVVGDSLGGVLSDRILRRTHNLLLARRNLVVVCFLGSAGCLLPLMFTRDQNTIVLCLCGGFFLVEMTIGPMWAIPMDIAPKFSGCASGLMNTGSALAAILSPPVFGYLVDITRSWQIPFLGSIGLLIFGSGLAFWMNPDRPFLLENSVELERRKVTS